MTVTYQKQEGKFQKVVDIWDEFIDHLDSIYFPGAAETLSKEQIAFEYENYKENYA
jgi:hypothetical protein